MHYIFGSLLVLAFGIFSFVAGAQYGRDAEAKVIAFGLKLDAETKAEFKAIVDKVKTSVFAEYQKLAKYL